MQEKKKYTPTNDLVIVLIIIFLLTRGKNKGKSLIPGNGEEGKNLPGGGSQNKEFLPTENVKKTIWEKLGVGNRATIYLQIYVPTEFLNSPHDESPHYLKLGQIVLGPFLPNSENFRPFLGQLSFILEEVKKEKGIVLFISKGSNRAGILSEIRNLLREMQVLHSESSKYLNLDERLIDV